MSAEPCSQRNHGRSKADWSAATATGHRSQPATGPTVTSGTLARDAVAKPVEEEEEDHEFYLSPMGKIFKLYKRRAPVEVDEDDVPPRLLRLLEMGHRQVHEADLSTGSEESEDDVDRYPAAGPPQAGAAPQAATGFFAAPKSVGAPSMAVSMS